MRMPQMQWLVLALALVAAGCSAPEQRAERARIAMEQRMAVHGPVCVRLGNAPHSDPWHHCVVERSSRAELDEMSGYHMGWRHGIW